jgi:acyl carrier protein
MHPDVTLSVSYSKGALDNRKSTGNYIYDSGYTNVPYVFSVNDEYVSAIQDYASEVLPSYMCPSEWKIIDKMPQLSNGKIDRAFLAQMNILTGAAVVESSSTIEYVKSLWAAMLGIAEVGNGDNLYRLGGHSLLAMQIIAVINKKYAVNVKLSKFMQDPTANNLAAIIDELKLNNKQ